MQDDFLGPEDAPTFYYHCDEDGSQGVWQCGHVDKFSLAEFAVNEYYGDSATAASLVEDVEYYWAFHVPRDEEEEIPTHYDYCLAKNGVEPPEGAIPVTVLEW